MRRSLTLGVSLALLIAPAAAALPAPGPAPDNPLSPEPESRNNDIVMMVHGHAEPDPTAPTPAPPAHEALLATNDDATVRLALIPYSPDADGVWRPNDLSGDAPELLVDAPGFEDRWYSPNVDPSDHARCEDETTIEGHEGPLSACLVFEIPSKVFQGRNAPTLELHWDGGMEAYNVAAHVLMHDRFEGGPVPVSQADGLTGEPTPFVVQSAFDLVP